MGIISFILHDLYGTKDFIAYMVMVIVTGGFPCIPDIAVSLGFGCWFGFTTR